MDLHEVEIGGTRPSRVTLTSKIIADFIKFGRYLQPVFGIAAASFLFGDQLGLMFAAGVVLILGGLALAVANKRPAPPRKL
ncbi:hypothetical protein [Sinorhizobium americanum]|uniref:Permease of the drug/metabolite transporter (DMT) superfamily n=1 Tax=Sinorhizobium americanum TaxID=194963 RepID=A0A1L3LV79_9HYPH|nr:hypothetical protein [Sinorhizobium americanum]APG93956.1 permease of the drug/metabolite transporter (DMT) superfamily [Sinorhizobium americanum]OAP34064.1 hypothetical protein ATC00_28650 [Sinorhizobium americanum]